MFILTIRCFCILEVLKVTHAFLNENSKKIFQKPHELKDDALFGFSIAYHSGNSSLLVGAPLGSLLGKIYYMDVNNGRLTDESPFVAEAIEEFDTDYNNWLGAAVGVGPDFYVTCSPKFVEMKPYLKGLVPAPLSVCFIKQKQLRLLKFITEYQRKINTTISTERMDSFGWTINVAPNQRDVLVGGAAMYKGRVEIYRNLGINMNSVPELIRNKNAEQPIKYNFGYAIASGNFFSNQTAYAISTTYGDKGFGKVYFFDEGLNNIDTIIDDNLSSMFGAALCKSMLRGPALLVGAPSYTENVYTHDVGVVYIYAAQSESNHMTRQRTIKGTQSGGFFGLSIITLGDMDDDGNDEIVIAAPYEDDGRGAVYIYSGVDIFDGIFSRRIQPEKLKTFGYSLAVVPSATEYNGLAIGAIGSNSVVIYKGMASITVKIKGSMENLKMGNITELEIKACIDTEYPKKPIKFNAEIRILIKVTDQICKLHEDDAPPLKITEKSDTKLCRKNFKASCPAKTNSQSVISYKLTAILLEKKNTDYDPSRVLLSNRSVLTFEHDEKWACKEIDTELCKAELKVEINSSIARPYIVGSSTYETVSLTVLNSGATAYQPCVEVQVQGADVSRLPPECTMRAGTITVICTHKRYIQKGSEWVIGNLMLQPRTEITITKEYYVTVKCIAYYDCKKPNDNRTFEEKYILKGDTDHINIKGQTNPEGDVDVTPLVLLNEGKSFDHLYIIQNKGSTSWNSLQIQITLENAPYIHYPDVPIKIYQDSSYMVCPIEDTTQMYNQSIKVLCNVGDLLKLTETTVIISMKIPPNTLVLDKNKPSVNVITTINVMGMNKSLSEQSLVKLQVASVPAWVIATASVIALVCISLIAYALYKFGFYKRATKEKLVTLKENVYRQSIRRSMIRDSMRAAARRKSTEDIQFLPEADDDCPETEMTIDEMLQSQK